MLRFCFAVLGYAAAMVIAVAVCVRAAGTNWVFPILFVLFFAVFWLDWFNERRPARLSALQRFERREAERRRAA